MILKRYLFFVIAIVLLISSCKKNNQFTISGRITHAEGETIYLEKLEVSKRKPIAECVLDRNGEFEFKGETGIPSFYLLRFSENKIITLLVDSLENVVVEADIANFSREYHVEGSIGSEMVKELVDRMNVTERQLDSIQALDKLYKGNPDYDQLLEGWNNERRSIIQEQMDYSADFVTRNPFYMASVYALYQRFSDGSYVLNDFQAMRTAASALHSIYPESPHVQALYKNTLRLLENQRAARVQQFIEEKGENSPDIVLPDTNGDEIALSSLRGKVVLLHFWSAEDRNSRIVNPALVEAYKKYKKKGFEIYQVSVDDNRIEWVDAIDKDKLSWINVGDMEGSVHAANVYNVRELPFNYLLDKEGNILAKNLKGPALDKALAQVLK